MFHPEKAYPLPLLPPELKLELLLKPDLVYLSREAYRAIAELNGIKEAKYKMKQKLKLDYKTIYNQGILDHIFEYPVTYPTFLSQTLEITYQTASKYLSALEKAKLLTKKQSGPYTFYYNYALINCLKSYSIP